MEAKMFIFLLSVGYSFAITLHNDPLDKKLKAEFQERNIMSENEYEKLQTTLDILAKRAQIKHGRPVCFSCRWWQRILVYWSGFTMFNQWCCLLLIASRYYALSKPMSYKVWTKKKSIVFVMVGFVVSFVIGFIPGIARTQDLKTSLWIFGLSGNFWPKVFFAKAFFIMTTLCALYFGQVFMAVNLNKSYQLFLEKTAKLRNKSEEERKKMKDDEKDKLHLLFGTVGLNLVCMLPTLFLEGQALYNVVMDNRLEGVAKVVSEVATALSDMLNMLNSFLSIIIHVLFTKSYRKAFKAVFPRCFKKVTKQVSSNNPSQQSQGSSQQNTKP